MEDIWLLDSTKARECGLDDKLHLVVLVQNGGEAHLIEEKASKSMREQFGDIGIHVFPHTVMYQMPRPLLVKMAFSGGRQVYCR